MEIKLDLSNGDKLEIIDDKNKILISKYYSDEGEWKWILKCSNQDFKKLIQTLKFFERMIE